MAQKGVYKHGLKLNNLRGIVGDIRKANFNRNFYYELGYNLNEDSLILVEFRDEFGKSCIMWKEGAIHIAFINEVKTQQEIADMVYKKLVDLKMFDYIVGRALDEI